MKNKKLRIFLIILGISVIITFIFDFTFGGKLTNYTEIILNILYGTLIGGSLSLSGLVTRFILKKSNLKSKPVKTYTLLLILIAGYITIDVFVINILWYHFTQNVDFIDIITNNGIIISSIITIFIGLTIFFIILSKSFINKLLDAEKEIQKSRDQADKSKFETLKTQINPHFLFNSLNTLSSLIEIDTAKADEFTKKLSNIYRYILDNQDNELVAVESEMNFIKEYFYLQAIRFDNNFSYKIADIDKFKNKLIIPMSLQIIVENIFKHNVISAESQINISINSTGDYIVVSNNKTKTKNADVSHKTGLKNLNSRYVLICEKSCIIDDAEKSFTVKLPLINQD